jgi:hypothetical protein
MVLRRPPPGGDEPVHSPFSGSGHEESGDEGGNGERISAGLTFSKITPSAERGPSSVSIHEPQESSVGETVNGLWENYEVPGLSDYPRITSTGDIEFIDLPARSAIVNNLPIKSLTDQLTVVEGLMRKIRSSARESAGSVQISVNEKNVTDLWVRWEALLFQDPKKVEQIIADKHDKWLEDLEETARSAERILAATSEEASHCRSFELERTIVTVGTSYLNPSDAVSRASVEDRSKTVADCDWRQNLSWNSPVEYPSQKDVRKTLEQIQELCLEKKLQETEWVERIDGRFTQAVLDYMKVKARDYKAQKRAVRRILRWLRHLQYAMFLLVEPKEEARPSRKGVRMLGS